MMPIIDGIEATRQIRALYPTCPPYIIALTANATEQDRLKCLEAGVDDFLPKPINLEKVKAALERYCTKKIPIFTF